MSADMLVTSSPYVAEFERFDQSRAGDPPWLRALRQQALARFAALGFPTTRQEEWRFTNVAPIANTAFRLSAGGGDALRREHLAGWLFGRADEVVEAVFVNGRFSPHLSTVDQLPDGVSVRSLSEVVSHDARRVSEHLARYAQVEDQPFTALNTAFLSDGVVVAIARNAIVEPAVHVVFVTAGSGEMSHPRVLVLAGRNSQARIVESYVGLPPERGTDLTASGFTNAVTEIVLDDGAVVDHYRVQRETAHAFHVSATQATLRQSASLSSHAFTFGGAIVRNDVNVVLAGEGGDATVNGLYVADGARLVDNHTFIDHAQPHCGSHEVYKGILGGRARAVFNGKILVRPDAQKTDAKQTNKTLLLSDEAQINTKPQLEIFANDVKCTHGATVGQLSADALFYLQSRGIDRAAGQQMLIRAFAADITSRIAIVGLRERLDAVLQEALRADL